MIQKSSNRIIFALWHRPNRLFCVGGAHWRRLVPRFGGGSRHVSAENFVCRPLQNVKFGGQRGT